MADFTVKPTNAASSIDDIRAIVGELDRYENEVRVIRNALGFKITASDNLRYRLNNAAERIESHRICAAGMGEALQDILNKYENTENEILGNEIAKGSGEDAASGNSDADESKKWDIQDFWEKFKKSALDALGKFGYTGGILSLPIALLKMLVDGDGFTEKDFGSFIKGLAKSGVKCNEFIEWLGDKKKDLAKLFSPSASKAFETFKPEAGWLTKAKAAGEYVFTDELGLESVDGKYRMKGSSIASWLLSFISNIFSNHEEYTENLGKETEITQGRAIAETISETVIDVVKGALITAGVTAGVAALGCTGFGAAALVAGGSCIVSGAADWICESLTGKGLTEWASDGLLDKLKEAGEKITGAVSSTGNAVASWFEKAFGPSSPQMAGA